MLAKVSYPISRNTVLVLASVKYFAAVWLSDAKRAWVSTFERELISLLHNSLVFA